MAKVRALTRKAQHHGLADLLAGSTAVLRGWCAYFRHGVSKATFGYLDSYRLAPGYASGCSSGTSESRGRNSTAGS